MDDMNIGKYMLSAFATPVVNYLWADAGDLNAELQARILQLEKQQPGVVKSNVGGWHSGLDFLDAEAGCVRRLRQRLVQAVTALGRQTLRPEAAASATQFRLEGWANVLRRGQYNSLHCHPNAFWSGVYYVNGNDAVDGQPFSGRLELIDPRPGASLCYAENTQLYGRFLLNPAAGQMLIFPAWLQHQVHPYCGDDVRISIAFNAIF